MSIYFPIEWAFGDNPSDGVGGPPVIDPGTIYFYWEDTGDDDSPISADGTSAMFKTTLTEIVDSFIEGTITYDGTIPEEHRPSGEALVTALRLASERLSSALKKVKQ